MTRNVQWRRQCSPTPSDELQLLRSKPPPSIVTSTTGSLTSCLISRRPEPSCTRISKPRCVSWAAEPLGLAAREYRRRATRSWCVAASAPIQPLPDSTRSSDSCNRSSVATFPVNSTGAYGSLAVATDTVRTRPPPEPLSQLSPSSPETTTASFEQTKDNCEQITTGGPTKPQINVPQQFLNISPPSSPQLPVKRKYRRSGIDFIMPSLRSLVSRRATSGSTSSLAGPTEKTPTIVTEGLRKCETAITLSAASSRTTLLAEPLQATNRLRVPPAGGARSLCSRCSSLLSLASGSRYSLNTAAATFVPVTSSTVPNVLCKLCLADVPHSNTCTLQHCACSFCKDCMQAYVAFEITEGAYDISCPDAQCPAQGVLTINEIERLVDLELVEKHKKFRLNREVDIDKSRTWCPRAGCETVCNLCPSEKCLPQSVHCPTCSTDFCSNCKKRWHGGSACEAEPPGTGIPFDSDLIKCCPMCSVPIEKDEGCAQMMCKRCKHVFCWYCLTSLDDDFLLRHYDKGPCKNKLGHSRASVIWHRTQVIGIFAGFGILLLVASPLLLLAAPCIVCCKCRMCNGTTKLDNDEEIAEESTS